MLAMERQDLCEYVRSFLSNAWSLAGIYLIWITLHYTASWLHAYWCTPWGLVGFVTTPFIVASPHCYGLRWCIAHGAETITAMWVVAGTWMITKLVTRGDSS